MAEWVAVCRLDEIREGRGVSREADGVRVAIFRDGGEVVCPLHRWRFRLADGRCTTVRGNSVHRFRCEARGEDVWVEV